MTQQPVPLVVYVNGGRRVVIGSATVSLDEAGNMAFAGVIKDNRFKHLVNPDIVNFSMDLRAAEEAVADAETVSYLAKKPNRSIPGIDDPISFMGRGG